MDGWMEEWTNRWMDAPLHGWHGPREIGCCMLLAAVHIIYMLPEPWRVIGDVVVFTAGTWLRSSSMVLCTSLSPPSDPSIRLLPIESTSSMKMIEGACSRAMTNSSRTILDPSPMYFCTSSEPETRMKQQSVWCATARARRVLPVPGGP